MSQSVQELLYELNSQRVRKMRAEMRDQYKAIGRRKAQERNDAREAEQFGEKAKLASCLASSRSQASGPLAQAY
jgi:hypothetical protein